LLSSLEGFVWSKFTILKLLASFKKSSEICYPTYRHKNGARSKNAATYRNWLVSLLGLGPNNWLVALRFFGVLVRFHLVTWHEDLHGSSCF